MKRAFSDAARFVMRALLDDYESLESLATYRPNSDDQDFPREEIRKVLAELLSSQHIEAFVYSAEQNKFVPTDESLESANELWFGLSKKGYDAVEAEQ